jgi:hypothetical protein
VGTLLVKAANAAKSALLVEVFYIQGTLCLNGLLAVELTE